MRDKDKRFEAIIATLLIIALALIVIAMLAITSGEAEAQEYTAPGEPVAYQVDPETNQPDFWCEPEMGVKYELVATPYVVPEPKEGTTWTLLVIKAGQTNDPFVNPVVGQSYTAVSGQDISHVILCWEEATVDTTTTTSTTTTSTTIPVTTTTTTQPTTTTTTDSTTTTSSSTTIPTTTTMPTTSTTTIETSTTTTVPPTTTTTKAKTLPMTGIETVPLIAAAILLILLGGATVYAEIRSRH